MILSAETFAELPTWHEPDRLFEAARVAVVPREGYPAPDPAWLAATFPGREDRVTLPRRPAARPVVDGDPRAASPPVARSATSSPRRVVAYIADNGLYRTAEPNRGIPPRTDPRAPARNPKGLPRRGKAAPPPPPDAEMPALDLARRIVELVEDKKAADIVLLDLSGLTTLADYFVIASGGSERQLDAIADGDHLGHARREDPAYGREGTAASHWVLSTSGRSIVHVFTPPERDYYQLEKAWSEAKTILRVQ